METRPELSRFIQKLLDDEGWQTGETEERRIKLEFATKYLALVDNEGWDLEQAYKRVLGALKAMR